LAVAVIFRFGGSTVALSAVMNSSELPSLSLPVK
jgi:hypothetical protein